MSPSIRLPTRHLISTSSPWNNLKGRTWIFALSGLSTTASFPAGFADSLEADAEGSGGKYIGGPGLVQVLSLSESHCLGTFVVIVVLASLT